MNPLCCIAPVSIDRGEAAAATAAMRPRPSPAPLLVLESPNPGRHVSSKSFVPAEAAALAAEEEEREAAKSAVAGILYKWVNYGKGWRARWFVLRDGVLSYYKVHGPDKISVGSVCEGGGVRVIGEDSARRVRKERYWGNAGAGAGAGAKQWKPFGEIHLKVRFFLIFDANAGTICFVI